jgi:hypothetical protein
LSDTCRTCQTPLETPDRRRRGICRLCRRGKDSSTRWYYFQRASERIRNRSKRHGIPCDITAAYLREIWTGICPVTGGGLTTGERTDPTNAHLDKIVPEKGYVVGNVAWISARANRIKSDATVEELRRIVGYVDSFTRRQ